MNTHETVNAEQLFLLCALRKGIAVKAKNQKDYLWTFAHYQATLEWHMNTREKYSHQIAISKKEDFMKKLKQDVPIREVKVRTFALHQNDFGFDLTDIEEDFVWYMPDSKASGCDECGYKELFILEEPLSEKEKYILQNFCASVT